MRIGLVSAEINPFAKMGGLGDVSAAIGKYLTLNGHDVRLVMPLYDTVDLAKWGIHPLHKVPALKIRLGNNEFSVDFFTCTLPGVKTPVYFVNCPRLFHRGGVYTAASDEYLRFAMLSLSVFELFKRLNWAPQVLHANDWHTALVPIYLKTLFKTVDQFRSTRSVLTIHNIGYQGVFPSEILKDLNLAEFKNCFDPIDLEAGRINFLKSGLLNADRITTVSPTYAREIQTPTFGAGLDELLRKRSADLVGILNGVDYDEWNPEVDPFIPFHYSLNNLQGKRKNKKALLEKAGLPSTMLQHPLVGMVSRLVEQKGIDLLMTSLPVMLARYSFGLVVLGSGDESYERFFHMLQLKFALQVTFFNDYDYALSHLIEAGADIFLMPSRYEPCGLNQIYSLKYGTVPVVHKTGGLADTVNDFDETTGMGDGFVFDQYRVEKLNLAFERALRTYSDRKTWRKIMRNGMKKDFSWEKQIKHYEALYQKLIRGKNGVKRNSR